MGLETYNWADIGTAEQEALLKRPAQAVDTDIRERVAAILDRVRRDGDAAIADLTAKFDGVELDSTRVSDSEIAAASARLDAAAKAFGDATRQKFGREGEW